MVSATTTRAATHGLETWMWPSWSSLIRSVNSTSRKAFSARLMIGKSSGCRRAESW